MMAGLEALSMYVEIIKKWKEIEGVQKFRIEDLKNGNPVVISITETTADGKKLPQYELYSTIENGKLIMLNKNNENVLELMKVRKNFSDEDMNKIMQDFRTIISKYRT